MPFQSMIIMDKFYEYMQDNDLATAFIDYLCRPAYSMAKRFFEGYNYYKEGGDKDVNE